MSDAPVAFFSYSREDSEFALRLASDLKAAGSSVWIDQLDIGPGQLWDRAVQNALESCPSVLIILSPASVNSDNVMDEVSFALDQKKALVPVLYRDCDIPFRVRRFQHLDFRSNYEQMLEELKKCLHIAGKPEAASVTESATSASSPTRTAEAHETPAPVVQSPQIPYPAPPMEQRRPLSSPVPAEPASPPKLQDPRAKSYRRWGIIVLAVLAGLFLLRVIINLASSVGSHKESGEPRITQTQPSSSKGSEQGNNESGYSDAAQLTGAVLILREGTHKCTAPEKTQTEFSVSDPAVELVFAYKNGSADDEWTIDWVRPNGETYKTQTLANPRAGSARYCYYIDISGFPPAQAPGNWGVRLNQNGQEMARLPFRIGR